MKFLIWLFVVILEVPAAIWMQIPSYERDRIKMEIAHDYMIKEAEKGATKFLIGERVHKFNFQLNIEVVERRI